MTLFFVISLVSRPQINALLTGVPMVTFQDICQKSGTVSQATDEVDRGGHEGIETP